jgi:hypothetical protein
MGKALRVESVCADAHANEIATPGEQQKRPRFSAEKKGKDSVDIRKRLRLLYGAFPLPGGLIL